LKEFTRLVRLDSKREAGEAASLAGRFNVKHAGLSYEVDTLSGGNRQKVLLARSVGLKPRVIIFDEPTAGIDVGAKSEIHSLIRNLANRGTGVIVISSELPELLALCSRIMVMRNRTIAGTLHRSEATEESLLHMATGSA
jgi:ribose transport system ATP-binding protein